MLSECIPNKYHTISETEYQLESYVHFPIGNQKLLSLNCSLHIWHPLYIVNYLRRIPVVRQPIVGVMLKILVTVEASINLSPTLFSVITTQLSLPRIATDVRPDVFTA